MHFAVLPGRNAVFLLESPEEGRIVRKSDLLRNGFQGDALFDQRLCGDQPPLGDAAVEADTKMQ